MAIASGSNYPTQARETWARLSGMFSQPDQVSFRLPAWINGYCEGYAADTDPRRQMAFVIGAARKNIAEGTGGPFAAAIFACDSGELVSLGVNLVTSEGLSGLHAEMVAIALAQRKLGTYDLGGPGRQAHRLVSSTEPCAMCFGAVPWSGVRQLVTGAHDADARAIGFDEGPKPDDWKGALESRAIEVTTDIQREDARKVLQDYLAQGDPIYNSRETRDRQ